MCQILCIQKAYIQCRSASLYIRKKKHNPDWSNLRNGLFCMTIFEVFLLSYIFCQYILKWKCNLLVFWLICKSKDRIGYHCSFLWNKSSYLHEGFHFCSGWNEQISMYFLPWWWELDQMALLSSQMCHSFLIILDFILLMFNNLACIHEISVVFKDSKIVITLIQNKMEIIKH